MEEVTARVCLVSISRSHYSAVHVGGHAKTALLHAAISAAAHQMCEMLMNVQFRFCRDERSELAGGLFCQISCTGCRFDRKKPFKIICLNRVPVLWYRGYWYSGTFFGTLYTYQLVL